MKQHKVWRYICDHCGKGYWKKKSYASHEIRCIRNISRVCSICERNKLGFRTIEEILVAMRVGSRLFGREFEYDTDELRLAAFGCPMCMLAVVMYVNKKEGWKYSHNREINEAWSIDYASEMKRFEEYHTMELGI